jgi:hypothetical protein
MLKGMAPDDKLPRGLLLAASDKIIKEVEKFSSASDADHDNEKRPHDSGDSPKD